MAIIDNFIAFGILAVVLIMGGIYVSIAFRRKQQLIVLKQIFIYPIKSCKGISLQSAKIGPFGFENDRKWMVYDPNKKKFITQRQIPQLALVAPTITENFLELNFPGMPTFKIPTSGKQQRHEPIVSDIRLWKGLVRGVDEGDDIANWLQEALQSEYSLRLIRLPDNHDRAVPKDYAQELTSQLVSFADGFPFLLAAEESLADLNSRLPKGEGPLPMRRFRPNLIIGGQGKSFAEDTWKRIKIADTVFRPVKKCTRCKMTTVDPDKGEFAGKEPLNTLGTFRKGLLKGGQEVCFGQNLIHESNFGEVKVGEIVQILA